jgi:HlyD family secretion protein
MGMDVPRPRPRRRKPLLLAAGGVLAAIAVTILLGRLSRAAPVVDRASVRVDEVKRGPFVRSVRAAGALVPMNVRWITAETAGRVERLHVRRGAAVKAGDPLMELENPDVHLQALEAERQLASAEAELVGFRTQLGNDGLAQESLLATLRADLAEARRQAEAVERLRAGGNASEAETARALEKRDELERRLTVEERRARLLEGGLAERQRAQRGQIEKLRGVARFRNEQLQHMAVRAPSAGVLQDLPLELGQWVTPGQLLAKIAEPGLLRADLRVPETLAGELSAGLEAEIDTRAGTFRGRVARIAPAALQGSVVVEVEPTGALPPGARADLSVDGVVFIERLEDVLYVGRPVGAQPGAPMELYRLSSDGSAAERVQVRVGRTSASAIELQGGLAEGDRVVLSDLPGAEGAERVRVR